MRHQTGIRAKTERTIKVGPDAGRNMSAYADGKIDGGPLDFEQVKKSFNISNSVTASHYSKARTIGFGGVGLVVSAHDPNLDRDVAIKMLRAENKNSISDVERFIREARATASIEHPNVIPVHELGVMEGVGVYFSMKRVQGENFNTVLEGFRNGRKEYVEKYTRHQLLEIFLNVCNGVAYAHSKGIIHRDLKPHNVLLGDFGEVLVMDWGLAKLIGAGEDERQTRRNMEDKFSGDSSITIDGTISGTPNYMPPEQAEGKVSELDERSDIYSLGAVLYQILTYEPPYRGAELRSVLEMVRKGDFIAPRKRFPRYGIPCELEAICLKAMAFEKGKRYQSVRDLAKDIRNYIEGFSVSAYPDSTLMKFRKLCRRHAVLSSTVASAVLIVVATVSLWLAATYFQFVSIMRMAEENMREGNSKYREAVETYRAISKMEEGRILKDKPRELLELEEKNANQCLAFGNHYETALMLYSAVPVRYRDHPMVNAGVSDIMFKRISFAIMTKDTRRIEKWIELIRLWMGKDLEDLPADSRNRLLKLEKDIKGDGHLILEISPAPADVVLFELRDSEDGRSLPQKPVRFEKVASFSTEIPKGAYLLEIKAEGRQEVRTNFRIDHGEKDYIRISIPETVPEGMAYVPGGKFYTGGDNSRYYKLHEEEVSSFFISKTEVTFGEYVRFWKSLDKPEERRRHMARLDLNLDDREYVDAWNDEGALVSGLSENLPVVGLLHISAEAYCKWLSGIIGKKVMLPTAEQWEKAARGCDGRNFPWGDGFNAKLANISENTEARNLFRLWAPPGSFKDDISVYGVLDMGGNVREMTSSIFPDCQLYQIKGASYSTGKRFLYCAYSSDTPVVPSDVGFRYVIPLEEK